MKRRHLCRSKMISFPKRQDKSVNLVGFQMRRHTAVVVCIYKKHHEKYAFMVSGEDVTRNDCLSALQLPFDIVDLVIATPWTPSVSHASTCVCQCYS